MKVFHCIILLLTVCGGGTACASGEQVKIPASEVHLIHSAGAGRDYQLHVALPREAVNKQTPVLFMLDANAHFAMAVDLVRAMVAAGELPDFLIVGIGYPVERVDETIVKRIRDYSPVVDTRHEELVETIVAQPVQSGGAEAFLRFIVDEVKPFVARRYGSDMAHTIFYGHSMGGLFGLYTLFEAPQTFGAYIIGSPPILWGDDYVMKAEAAYAGHHQDLAARIYMAAGQDESDLDRVLNLPEAFKTLEREFIESMGNPNPLAQMEAFVQALRHRKYPSLEISFTIFPEEKHSSVPAPLLSHGLRSVWTVNSTK